MSAITHRKIMPKGSVEYNGKLSWEKYGGHAGAKTVGRVCRLAIEAGFVWCDPTCFSSPDGNVMGSGTLYKHADGTVFAARSSYGVVASENRFSLVLANPPVTLTDGKE